MLPRLLTGAGSLCTPALPPGSSSPSGTLFIQAPAQECAVNALTMASILVTLFNNPLTEVLKIQQLSSPLSYMDFQQMILLLLYRANIGAIRWELSQLLASK